MADTWAERDLDGYLRAYALGSDISERRTKKCLLCGRNFDMDEGVTLPIYRNSAIRVEGKLPKIFYVCSSCYGGAEKIESEDEYERDELFC